MSGAFDRTGEFRACTQSFHDRLLSGRLRLKPPHPKNSSVTENSITTELLTRSKQMSGDLKMTVSKMAKLKILLQGRSNSSPDVLSKLIEVIQLDIIDLNKAKLELKASIVRVKEHSVTNTQHLKHIDLIVISLEYHLSFLVSEFRLLLEEHKSLLSTDSKMSNTNIPTNPDVNQLTKCASYSEIITSDKNHFPSSFQNISYRPTEDNRPQKINHFPGSPPSHTLSLPTHTANSHSSSNLSSAIPVLELNSSSMNSRPDFYDSSRVGATSQATEQLQLFASNPHVSLIDQEVRQRDAAIRRVESTIVQLGEIYQQFSSLVQEQGDLVLRIDSQTDDMEMNISEAHAQLLVFMRRISAQRGFLIKVFVTIIICFVVFAWIMR